MRHKSYSELVAEWMKVGWAAFTTNPKAKPVDSTLKPASKPGATPAEPEAKI
jgi:hypothetical protein